MKRGPTLLIVLLGAFFLITIGVPVAVGFLTDWLWFGTIGYETIFLTQLGTKTGLAAGAGLFAFAFFYVNLRIAQRGLVPDPVVVSLSPNLPMIDLTRVLRRLVLPVSLLLGLLVGVSVSGIWLTLLRFVNQVPFDVADPVFGRDVGYYVFTLPAVSAALGVIVTLTVLVLVMVVPIYVLRRDILVAKSQVRIEPSAGTHLAVLMALLFVLTAANVYFVGIPSLVYSTTGPLFGASYTDLAVSAPLLKVAAVVALIGAGVVIAGARSGRLLRHTLIAVVGYVIVSGVLGTFVPSVVQRLVVAPNELVRETPQLQHHISATRRAWGLNDVLVRDLSGEARLSLDDIQINSGTIKNVRLWDREPLLQTFGQLQEIRTYYDFVSVDDDRYWIDGEYRQVLLSPRELNSASLPTRTFINERLTFTHGMGLTLSPVNQVTLEGLPVLFVKDLPPSSSVSLQVTRPGIYYGELSNDHVFVNTRQEEFDYPSGEDNAFTNYEGDGGVRVGSLARRALLAARFRSLKVLLSQDITAESQVLFYRNIQERVEKALPFLRWDDDPYLVIAEDGRLKWILDAYTSSTRYPYAQPLADGTNYLRNSVKVVLDAYDGDLQAYVAVPDDPIIQTYARAFDGVFKPLSAMPADLKAHIRYPEDLFAAQTALYTTYHMDAPQIFYHREDQWQIPVMAVQGSSDPFLRRMIMKLPGEGREEFISMTPFTPRQKDNLAAWMVARSDGDDYGQLVVYRFPRQSLVFGPTQILNRINQDTEISRQVSLWDQRGSEVIRGNLLVIPIEESLIFVQALYLRAEGGRIPELKRVVVAYQNQVVMEETLDRGLTRLFGGSIQSEPRLPLVADASTASTVVGPSVADLAREASSHYEQAIAAQRTGNWTEYGERMRLVGETLRRLENIAASPN